MNAVNIKTRILITGGHVTPAYAVIEELKKRGYSKISFVGRKYSDRAKKDISFEYNEITSLNIPFYHLTTGRLSRNFGIHTLYDIGATVYGFIASLILINKLKPQVILSFGGYIALPVAIVGWFLGITIVTHEQTIAPGISNKIIGTIADKVLVSFIETTQYFGAHKTFHTGNPIRTVLHKPGEQFMTYSGEKPLLFITGGSMGSHSINVHIEKILEKLLDEFTIVHQVGNVSEFDDYTRLSKYASNEYVVIKNLNAHQMAWAYKKSALVVARSGANTTWELVMLKKPAVLVPLPWSGRNEQRLQARFFVEHGLGEEFDQIEPSDNLLRKIRSVYLHRDNHISAFRKLPDSFMLPAAESIVDIMGECVK